MRPLAGLTAALALAALPALGQTLDRIIETGEIRLGVRSDAAPMSFLGEDGTATGYSVEICNEITDILSESLELETLTPVYVSVDAGNRFDAIAEGRIDLLCGAASVTLARREIVDFSLPVYVDGTAVAIPKGADPNLSALAGKKAGVREGTTTEKILTDSFAAANIDAEIVRFVSYGDGFKALEDSEVDAFFADQSILYNLFFTSSAKDRINVSENTLTIEKQALALLRGDNDFRLEVDRAISALFQSGRIAEIFQVSLHGAKPGLALKALYLISPDLP
jgi:polar amino acid transport system substrate-binding protein